MVKTVLHLDVKDIENLIDRDLIFHRFGIMVDFWSTPYKYNILFLFCFSGWIN